MEERRYVQNLWPDEKSRIMNSIIRMSIPDDVDKAIEQIESLTTAKVLSHKIFGNLWLSVMLEEHGGPVCPKCGQSIHSYGHGLCKECWLKVKRETNAIC